MNVLDKGEVRILGAAPSGEELYKLMYSHYRGHGNPSLLTIGHLSIYVRAPIFVCLYFAQYLKIFPSKNDNRVELYTPSEVEIGAKTLEISKEIHNSIVDCMETQINNAKTYTFDGCDTSIAQIVLPVATYATYIVTGSIKEWLQATNPNQAAPNAIEAYKKEVQLLVYSEYSTVIGSVDVEYR